MEKICEECGKTFEPRTARQLTCSEECSKSRHNRKCKERNKITIEKICIECGEKFLTNRRKTVTCSQRCASKRSAARRKYNASCLNVENKRKTTEIGTIENMARKAGLTYGQYVALQYAKGGR